MHGLEAEYWDKVDFVYIDHEDSVNRPVLDRYQAYGRPIFILVKPDGTEIQRWFGYVDADDLRAGMDDYLRQAS